MGHFFNLKCLHSPILSLKSAPPPFRPTTEQMPSLAIFETKRITVYGGIVPAKQVGFKVISKKRNASWPDMVQ
jgi:hypothetical protein